MKSNVWYHGTTEEAWKKIQKEGFLWGTHKNGRRFTYLCLNRDEASHYGDITLRVEYDPILDLDNNNFSPDTFEMGEIKVTSPIQATNVRKV